MTMDCKSRGDRIAYAIYASNAGKISALAMELGVNESAISRWKKNGNLTIQNVGRFCEILDVSLDWIILGRGHCFQHRQSFVSNIEQDTILALRKYDSESTVHLNKFLHSLKPLG